MSVPEYAKNLPKDSVAFAKDKPKNLEQVWPWGLRLVNLLRPIAQATGDIVSVSLYDELESACHAKDEERFDKALILLNETKKAEANRAFRMVKGGVRLFVRPFTNTLRKALGKKKLRGTEKL